MDGHYCGWPILYRIKEGLTGHQQGLRISRRRQGGDVNPGFSKLKMLGFFLYFKKCFQLVVLLFFIEGDVDPHWRMSLEPSLANRVTIPWHSCDQSGKVQPNDIDRQLKS